MALYGDGVFRGVQDDPPPAITDMILRFLAVSGPMLLMAHPALSQGIDRATCGVVLLFLSRANGQLFHQKYQYADGYETADGSRAGCGDLYRLEPTEGAGALSLRTTIPPAAAVLAGWRPTDEESQDITRYLWLEWHD